jgi:hypothetical protein
MIHTPNPHVSPALLHLRHGVTASALLLALCAVVQMLVFGFVHFTEIRWTEAPPPQASSVPYAVVSGQNSGTVAAARPAQAEATPSPEVRAKPNPSSADSALQVASDLAVTCGFFAAILLAFFCTIGAVVAGGGAVPGVARAVSAAMWSALVAAACIPWSSILPTIPYAGVFGPYSVMTQMSEAAAAGTGSNLLLIVHFFMMPTAAMAASFLILYRFRTGIAEGIIVTSVSELDERLEREMATIRNRGIDVAGAARAVGALHHAIGEHSVAAPEPAPKPIPFTEPAALRKTGTAPAPARSGRSWMNKDRRFGETDPGDPLKRPI